MKIKWFFASVIATVVFSACSFQKNLINPSPLTISTLPQLNGRYKISSLESVSEESPNYERKGFLREIDDKLLPNAFYAENAKQYSSCLTVLKDKRIKIACLEQQQVVMEWVLKCRLKKDGYLYLRNKNIKIAGLPYILGGVDAKRIRLAKTVEGDLIVDVVDHKSGALILIIGSSYTRKYRKTYVREN